MGTWGPGNFDSDDAVDYLSEVVRGFVDTVEQLFAQGRASLDDQGEGRLMPTVELKNDRGTSKASSTGL